jgi:hypothetical protein
LLRQKPCYAGTSNVYRSCIAPDGNTVHWLSIDEVRFLPDSGDIVTINNVTYDVSNRDFIYLAGAYRIDIILNFHV